MWLDVFFSGFPTPWLKTPFFLERARLVGALLIARIILKLETYVVAAHVVGGYKEIPVLKLISWFICFCVDLKTDSIQELLMESMDSIPITPAKVSLLNSVYRGQRGYGLEGQMWYEVRAGGGVNGSDERLPCPTMHCDGASDFSYQDQSSLEFRNGLAAGNRAKVGRHTGEGYGGEHGWGLPYSGH